SEAIVRLTRRDLLRMGVLAGTGLALGVSADSAGGQQNVAGHIAFAPNGFLRVDPDGKVTIWASRTEIGQGIRTSLAMLVAEELEVDWPAVTVVQAGFDPKLGDQSTYGSRSI